MSCLTNLCVGCQNCVSCYSSCDATCTTCNSCEGKECTDCLAPELLCPSKQTFGSHGKTFTFGVNFSTIQIGPSDEKTKRFDENTWKKFYEKVNLAYSSIGKDKKDDTRVSSLNEVAPFTAKEYNNAADIAGIAHVSPGDKILGSYFIALETAFSNIKIKDDVCEDCNAGCQTCESCNSKNTCTSGDCCQNGYTCGNKSGTCSTGGHEPE